MSTAFPSAPSAPSAPASTGTRALVRVLLIAGVLSIVGIATIPIERHVGSAQPPQAEGTAPAAVAAAPADPRLLPGANAPLQLRDAESGEPVPTF